MAAFLRHLRLRQLSEAPWALWVVVGLAALLRLSYLDLAQFDGWDASTLELAAHFLDTGQLPLTDRVSDALRIANLPIDIYLTALPLLLSRDPAVAMGLAAAAHVGGVWLAYRLLKEHFGSWEALAGGALFAANLSAVLAAKSLTDVPLQIPLVVLFLWGLLAWALRGSAWGLFGAVTGLALAFELHPAAFPLVLFFGLVLLVRIKKVQPLPFLTGMAIALATIAPYLYHEVQRGFPNFRLLTSWAGRPATYDLTSLALLLDLISTEAIRTNLAAPWAGEPLAIAAGAAGVWDVVVLFFLVGVAALAWEGLRYGKGAKDPRQLASLLLLLAVGAPVLGYVRHQVPVMAFYLQSIQGLTLLVAGIGAAWLIRMGRLFSWRGGAGMLLAHLLTGAITLALTAAVAAQVLAYVTLMGWLDQGQTTIGSSLPLRHSQRLVQRMVALQREHGAQEIAVLARVQTSIYTYLLRGKAKVRVFDDTSALAFPPLSSPFPTLYVTMNDDRPGTTLLRETVPEFQIEAVPIPNGSGSSYRFFLVPPQAQRLVQQRLSWSGPSLRIENGLELVGHRLPPRAVSGEVLRLSLLLRVPPETTPSNMAGYHLFYHLLDNRNAVWGEWDEAAWPLLDVVPGSLMVLWREIPLKERDGPAQAWLFWGLYREGDQRRLLIEHADGRPIGEVARLGAVKITTPPLGRTYLPPDALSIQVSWENGIVLRAYQWHEQALSGRRELTLTLFWAATAPLSQDLSVFVHLLDEEGRLVAQQDGYPLAGNYPTSLWEPGEFIVDEYVFEVPATLREAKQIALGFYNLATMARIPVLDPLSGLTQDHLLLPAAR